MRSTFITPKDNPWWDCRYSIHVAESTVNGGITCKNISGLRTISIHYCFTV